MCFEIFGKCNNYFVAVRKKGEKYYKLSRLFHFETNHCSLRSLRRIERSRNELVEGSEGKANVRYLISSF